MQINDKISLTNELGNNQTTTLVSKNKKNNLKQELN